MTKQQFSRAEVINILDELLMYPDVLQDAINNENTDWAGERLLGFIEEANTHELHLKQQDKQGEL